MYEDLHWLGLSWSEGPDVGGPFAPYNQSERKSHYRRALERLHALNLIYPCTRSRKDVLSAAGAPHESDEEPVYPSQFRPDPKSKLPNLDSIITVNWRMRVPDNERLYFLDHNLGTKEAVSGSDFGDFLVWRKDDTPSYQLACVVDDFEMKITEVVRGADLITSTFRQILLNRALGYSTPEFYHCKLMLDENGVRLAKRHDALSIRHMRNQGMSPIEVRELMFR
jgi:glutamyl-tRNA synthetase